MASRSISSIGLVAAAAAVTSSPVSHRYGNPLFSPPPSLPPLLVGKESAGHPAGSAAPPRRLPS